MGSSDSSLCSPESQAAFQLPLAPHTHTHIMPGRDGGLQRQPQVKHTRCLHLIDVRLTRTCGAEGFITFLIVVLCASLSCHMLSAVTSAWNVFGKSVPSGKQEHMIRDTCIKSLLQFMNCNLNWPRKTGSWNGIWLIVYMSVFESLLLTEAGFTWWKYSNNFYILKYWK